MANVRMGRVALESDRRSGKDAVALLVDVLPDQGSGGGRISPPEKEQKSGHLLGLARPASFGPLVFPRARRRRPHQSEQGRGDPHPDRVELGLQDLSRFELPFHRPGLGRDEEGSREWRRADHRP